jgi:GntR family transcriptional repressor for pyruvate dehydrogenase complex
MAKATGRPDQPKGPQDSGARGSSLRLAPAVKAGARLSEQLAESLAIGIRDGQLPPGQRLPTEAGLAQRFGVSRTVVREALSRLRTLGLIETRQGSGAYVKAVPGPALSDLSLSLDGSIGAVLQMVEVRRALEAESAALAAARRTPAQLRKIRQALTRLERQVGSGGDGVEEDVAFHAAIAQASGNPFLLATLTYLSQFLREATRVTRANEARHDELQRQVRHEHAAIVAAIEAGDVRAARVAGARHMVNAAQRIGQADPAFWALQGRQLAERLRAELGSSTAG